MYIKEGKAIKQQIVEICYFMNGGLEFNTAWGLSHNDREMIVSIINKRRKEENPGGKEYM